MKITKRLPDLDSEERLDCEMQDEIDYQLEYLKTHHDRLNNLLGHKRVKEVRKAMINFLVEQL